jgi:hypothetical protein
VAEANISAQTLLPRSIVETEAQFQDRILDVKLAGRRITVPDLVEAVSRVLSILREVDACTTRVEGGSVEWVIRGLESGSAVMVLEAAPKGEATPVWAPSAVVRHFAAGMRHVLKTGERPEWFSNVAMRRAYELTALLDTNGIEAITFGRTGDGVTLTPELRKPVKDALEGRYRAFGSIEGRIDSLSAHEEPYQCTVYSFVSGEGVRCYFGPELLSTVHENFRKRVVVRGVFTTRPNGEVTSLRASEVEHLPEPEELPSVDDILGILAHGD